MLVRAQAEAGMGDDNALAPAQRLVEAVQLRANLGNQNCDLLLAGDLLPAQTTQRFPRFCSDHKMENGQTDLK